MEVTVIMTPRGQITVEHAPDGAGAVIREPDRTIYAPYDGRAYELNPDGSAGSIVDEMNGAPRPPRPGQPEDWLKRWGWRLYGIG